MVENSTHQTDTQSGNEPLAALEQVQRELNELAQAMSDCQSDIDAAVRQPEELAKQKAELFDRFQQEHERAEARRKQLEILESQLTRKQQSLDRLAKQIESKQKAIESGAEQGKDMRPSAESQAEAREASRSHRPALVRLVVDMVVLLMVLGGGAGYWWMQHQQATVQQQIEQIRGAMKEIHNQALLHGSQGGVPVHISGYPLEIDKSWFSQQPVNGLVPGAEKWLEVAGASDYAHANPQDIVASSHEASFWYNPARGIVRARVPMQMTDDATVELYNEVNATSLRADDVQWETGEQ